MKLDSGERPLYPTQVDVRKVFVCCHHTQVCFWQRSDKPMMLRAMIPQTIMRLIAADRYGGFGFGPKNLLWRIGLARAIRP